MWRHHHAQTHTVLMNRSDDEVLELLSEAPGLPPPSFNLPSADGELTGHLIQSERCQLAPSERERALFFLRTVQRAD